MTGKQLKNSILQWAIQGKLVPQDPNDEPASVLLDRIRKEKAQLVKEGKLKKKDLEETPIAEDEKPLEIPESWEWVRLSDVVNVIMGQAPDGNDVYDADNGGNDYEFHQGKICFTEKYINPSGKWCKSPTRIASTDSLLVCVRAPIGDVNITQRNIGIGRGLAAIKGFAGIQTLFLYFWMSAHKKNFVDQGTGSTFKAITVEVLKNQPIPLPPLAEQHRIVEKIEELLPMVEKYGETQEALDKLNTELPERMKKSILQEAIEGRLVPQDPNDEPASVLLDRIRKEKAQLVKAGKLKKKDLEEIPIAEDEIPFEIPESWEWVRWGMLGEYKKGPFGSSLTKSMFVPKTDDAVKVYEQKNAIQKDYSLGDYYISKEKYETMKGFTVNPGDIIVSCAGTIGETYLLPQDAPVGIINQALMRARLHFDSIIPYWLLNFRYILLIENKLKGSGSAIKNIPSFEVLKAMPVPLPPLAEQHRIVSKIEELFGNVDKLKA